MAEILKPRSIDVDKLQAKKDSCEFKVRRGFIKEVCIDQLHDLEVYKCPNSNSFYFPNRTLIGPDVPPDAIYFDQVCENDPRFYQACGAGQGTEVISNDEKVLCGYFVCQVEINQQSLSVLSKPLRRMGWFCNGRRDCTNTDLDETMGCEVGEESGNVPDNHGVVDEESGNVPTSDISCQQDDSDVMCVKGTSKCTVHKHKMCDVTFDCDDKWDEKGDHDHCKQMTKTTTCTRAGSSTETSLLFPLTWVLDGEVDCVDGVDEDASSWRVCGDGVLRRYVEKGDECEDVMICPGGFPGFVRLGNVCSDRDACGGKLEVCKSAQPNNRRNSYKVESGKLLKEDYIPLSYCIKGMESMQELYGPCTKETLTYPSHETYGVQAGTHILLPTRHTNCDGLYGEEYLYQSCLGRCPDSPCPLQTPPRYEHCPDQFPERVGTLADNSYLTFFVRSLRGEFRNDFFVCKDGQKCIEYSRVCDLIEDCHDGSDEILCTNSFQCSSDKSHSHLPISSKCDGKVDCADLSDECNDQCSRRLISSAHLRNFSWVFGILAVGANSFVIVRLAMSLRKCRTAASFTKKIMVGLMSIGGFLIGIYLQLISIADSIYFKDTFCLHQIHWLTSYGCSSLGVISTFASQISLFAMLGLSLTRATRFCKSSRISSEVTRRTVTVTMIMVFFITVTSLLLALVPLLELFQEHFVLSMKYSQNFKLFVGFSDKSVHLDVLQAYYGRVGQLNGQLSWKNIDNLLHGMFTHHGNEVDNQIGKTKVPFYGSSPLCLSKFSIDEAGPHFQFIRTVLGLDVTCISIIAVIYLITTCTEALFCARRSAKQTNTDKSQGYHSRAEGRELNIAIMAGVGVASWSIFILLCAIPSIQLVDMRKHDSTCFMIFQGLIAVVNPLIYSGIVLYTVSFIAEWGRTLKSKMIDVMPSTLKRSTPMIFSSLTASPEIELESVSVESESESGLQINTLSMPDSVFDINSESREERHLKRSKEFNESIFESEYEFMDSAANKDVVDAFEVVIKSFDESSDSNNILSDDYFENRITYPKNS
ncbi:hypothetical protein ACHWQZ_G004199 [Mnemiopsis leidyi]